MAARTITRPCQDRNPIVCHIELTASAVACGLSQVGQLEDTGQLYPVEQLVLDPIVLDCLVLLAKLGQR